MELEISVEDLLNKHRIESDRVEFKASWNPDDIYHSVCAFANDYDNVGGGYILIGVEECKGIAVRPVKGIEDYEIDAIQKEIVGYNNSMVPAFFPRIILEEVDGKNILVLWVMTGAGRPYKAPDHVTSKKNKKLYYYIRYASSSVRANAEQERELLNMTNHVPFDLRPNYQATEDDISVPLLIEHLKKTKSRLAKQVLQRGVMEILGDMQLLVGPMEQRYLTNVALMMFCDSPDRFFPYTQVEITKFPDGSIRNPNHFVEVPVIKGSVPEMITRTMQKLQDMVIFEKVTKVNYQMEAIRRFSYPYQALEEVVVNAFYHRDYMSCQPIIIEIEPELVRVISYPGIDRSISRKDIEAGDRFSTRYYRNKRLGEFLKELDLSEGKCTGIPTIQEELRNNGSPKARFYTDEDRRAVTVEIPIHPDFLENQSVVTLETAHSGEKQPVAAPKTARSNKKQSVSDDQAASSENNLPGEVREASVFDEEQLLRKKLRETHYTKKTRENIVFLYHALANEVFGRSDIVATLGLSESAARDLLKKMRQSNLVSPVTGYGKGRYRF
ncbi:MAG: putative DNA binding domain-containing protein [Lachnospiraceae bacterium]|nr:putative DNA binding domain-containing protein [Lachnospiraceae bacterium]